MEISKNTVVRIKDTNPIVLKRVHEIDGGIMTMIDGTQYSREEIEPVVRAGETYIINGVSKTAEADIGTLELQPYDSIEIRKVTKESPLSPMGEKIKNTLVAAHYFPENSVITKIEAEWEKNKERLKNLLSKHPNWDEENLCIREVVDYPNPVDTRLANDLFCYMMNAYRRDILENYIGVSTSTSFGDFMEVSEDVSDWFKNDGIEIHKGTKPTRALRKFFDTIGISRANGFEKDFARLADYLSEKPLRREITFSIHPLDYLNMSNGNSWTSCHSIVKRGCYHNGTQSYLMDSSAVVLSVINPNGSKEPYKEPKINRMMVFIDENGNVLQSRNYPQQRNVPVEEFLGSYITNLVSEILDIENVYKIFTEDVFCSNYVITSGRHYADYSCQGFGQRIWWTGNSTPDFRIGHASYCLKCGGINRSNSNMCCVDCNEDRSGSSVRALLYYLDPETGNKIYDLTDAHYNAEDGHYYANVWTCADCGREIFHENRYCDRCIENHDLICDECGQVVDNLVYVDGQWVCEECWSYCDDCNRRFLKKDLEPVNDENRYVCDSCLEDYYFCEDCEGHYSDTVYIEDHGEVCEYCYENGDYFYCDECGRYYEGNDTELADSHSIVCDDCLNEMYYCEECERYFQHYGSVTWIESEGRYICNDCLEDIEHFRCSECVAVYIGNPEVTSDGEYLCEHCARNYYYVCDKCGYYTRKLINFDDAELCSHCYEEACEEMTKAMKEVEEYEVVVFRPVKDLDIMEIGIVKYKDDDGVVIEFRDGLRYLTNEETKSLIPTDKIKPGTKIKNQNNDEIFEITRVDKSLGYMRIWCGQYILRNTISEILSANE